MHRISERDIRRLLLAAVVVDVAFWTIWFAHRPWVASTTGRPYTQFENAFPLADAWLALACVFAWIGLRRRAPMALLWLLAAGGAGIYLFSMDVLYDLEHGIYAKGSGGVIEALVNVVTLTFATIALRWSWQNRTALLRTGATS
jgi:hypothetical protein